MYAVIMAGGKGERLWPKTTKGRAKHILAFGRRNVMIHETLRRLKSYLPPDNIFLITTKKQFSGLRAYVSLLPKDNIILEPEGKDTAVAICLAALVLKKRFGNQTMVVLPADHIINDSRVFFKDLLFAEKIAGSHQRLVTIGIKPRYASVGYGYIELGRRISGAHLVKRFTEKPEKKKAERFYRQGTFLWNSGIFIWETDSILAALKRHMPNLYYGLKDTLKSEGKRGYAIRLSNEYSGINPVSIDYGIIEPAAKSGFLKILCIKAGFDWVDIGSWSSIEEIYDKDICGNIVLSKASLIDVRGSIIIGERNHKIGVIGVKDLIIVQSKSGTLVCNKNRAQEVKNLLKGF